MCTTLMEIMKDDIDKVVQQGMQQGSENERLGNVRSLMKTLNLSLQKAMDALLISDEAERARIAKAINAQ